MLLGYGDSSVQIFDMRSKRSTMSFNDPHLKAIGEIKFDYQTKNFAMFGIPAFSLWQFDDSNLNCIANHQMTDSNTISSFDNMYKTSGDFRKGSNSLLVTDRYPFYSYIFYFNNSFLNLIYLWCYFTV